MNKSRPSWLLSIGLLTLGFALPLATGQLTDAAPEAVEQPAEPLRPRVERGEAEEDHVTAASYFAHGRLLVHRGSEHEALRQFERAWRFDPDAVSISREIIPLASRLDRQAEAARYAVLAAERHPAEFPQLLPQLAAILASQGQTQRAIGLLRKALELQPEGQRDLALVGLHLELGRLSLIAEQPESAADSFAIVRAAFDDPDSFQVEAQQLEDLVERPQLVDRLIAESFLQAGRLDDAEAAFEHLYARRPDAALEAFDAARLSARRNRWSEARSHLEEYLTGGSTAAGAQPYALLREILGQTAASSAEAETQWVGRLAELAEAQPKNAPLLQALAAQLRDQNQQEAAAARYREAVALEPNAAGYRALVSIYREQEAVGPLLKLLAEVLRRAGSLAIVRDELQMPPDSTLIVKLTEGALADPSREICLAATLAVIAAGAYEQADQLHAVLVESSADAQRPEVFRQVGLELLLADQSSLAAARFEQALSEGLSDDARALIYYYLAGAYAMADRHDEALEAAEQAAALNDEPRFQSRPAWILYHARRYEEAEQRYQRLARRYDLDFSSDDVRETLRDAHFALSNLAIELARIADAEEWLAKVLDEFPEDAGALNDLGYLWADQGKHLERALRMVQSAVEAFPDNVAYRDSLGWAYYRLGRFDEAVRELEQAVSAEEEIDGVILDHLGDAYLQLDQTEKALATWRRAVEAFQRDGGTSKYLSQTEAKIAAHQEEH